MTIDQKNLSEASLREDKVKGHILRAKIQLKELKSLNKTRDILLCENRISRLEFVLKKVQSDL